MELIGKTPINPFLFYSGKIAGYLTWALVISKYLKVDILKAHFDLLATSVAFFGLAILLIILSSVFLGKSVRLGLPTADTNLKSKGIYKASRNPMYLGFDLLTISSILGTANLLVFFMGIYSIIIYDFIIRAEEQFLEARFGAQYQEYRGRVNRYIGWKRGRKESERDS